MIKLYYNGEREREWESKSVRQMLFGLCGHTRDDARSTVALRQTKQTRQRKEKETVATQKRCACGIFPAILLRKRARVLRANKTWTTHTYRQSLALDTQMNAKRHGKSAYTNNVVHLLGAAVPSSLCRSSYASLTLLIRDIKWLSSV